MKVKTKAVIKIISQYFDFNAIFLFRELIFIIALVFTFIIKIRFPKEVSIATILSSGYPIEYLKVI